jgi:hypothetical protein
MSDAERAQLLKIEKKAGIDASVMVSADGSKTAEFNRLVQHFDAVGAEANEAMRSMIKHRNEEKSAAAAVKKIQAQQDKAEANSDTALLTITSILGKYNGLGLLEDPKIKRKLSSSA